MATSTAPPAVFEEEGEGPLPAAGPAVPAPTSGGAYRGAYSQYYGGLSEGVLV